MNKGPFRLDEREMNVFRSICTTLYFITLYSLIGIQMYRQFALGQPQQEWNDIAMLIAVNVIVLLGSALFLSGAINPRKVKLSYIIAGYLGFVLLGFTFTIFKYTVLLDQGLTLGRIADYFFTVLKISGILVLVWGILAYMGSRRLEKQIE
jgi:heme/copper-type cytochrome/quinol oxidase subunit 3